MSNVYEIGNMSLTLYDEVQAPVGRAARYDDPKEVDVERQCKVLDLFAKKSLPGTRFVPARISGAKSDERYRAEMGAWTKPWDEQFAYTGGRKGDKEMLAGLVDGGYAGMAVAA